MKKKSLIETLKSTKKANVISASHRNEAAEKATSTRKVRLRRTKMAEITKM